MKLLRLDRGLYVRFIINLYGYISVECWILNMLVKLDMTDLLVFVANIFSSQQHEVYFTNV